MKNKTKKIISALLIILMIVPTALFFNPKQVNATTGVGVPVDTTLDANIIAILAGTNITSATTVKEWLEKLLEIARMAVAKAAIAAVTQSIINWINTGFHGAPTFLENPSQFFGDIMKSQMEQFVDVFGYDPRKYPFGRDLALSVINSYKSTLENNAAHSFANVMSEQQISNLSNFSTGGWSGFLFSTQYPQNNYLGFQMMTTDQLSSQLSGTEQTPASALNSLLQQGQGFLPPQKCMDHNGNNSYNDNNNPWNPPSFHCSIPDNCGDDLECVVNRNHQCDLQQADWAKTNTCKNLVNVTPGTVVADQIKSNLSSSLRQQELASALGDSIAAIVDAFINKVISTGLDALAGTMTSPNDNWSYNGQTLDNGGGGGGAGDLNIPQNVSIQLGSTTNPSSTNITGGTAPYSIKVTDPVTPDASIATAALSGSTLTITGVSPGSTSVTIKDSSPNVKHVTVSITVVGNGDLMSIPASITLNGNDQASAVISGGTAPYAMSTSPNENVAMGIFADGTLAVSGTAPGSTYAVITDSSSPAKTITINITVNNSAGLVISPQGASVKVGQTTSITISGGVADYTVEIPTEDAGIATATISGTTVTITGVSAGQTVAVIKDSSSPAQAISANITVTASTP